MEIGGVMNSYLVRIYRKAENNPRLLVGIVEEPGVKEKKAFSNLYELWDILNLPQKGKGSNRGMEEVNMFPINESKKSCYPL